MKEYIPYWNLDLGAGNIFKMKHNDPKQPKNGGQLPPIQFSRTTAKARNKRSFLPIKCTGLYLGSLTNCGDILEEQ